MIQSDLEQDLIRIETHAGFRTIDDPAPVAEYRKAYDHFGQFLPHE